jgi:hypothetical protein
LHDGHRPEGLALSGTDDVHITTYAERPEYIPGAPTSMVITGALEEWRTWTGLPFQSPGEVEVPGALVPVLCMPHHNYAVYVEPNVWKRHRLSGTAGPATQCTDLPLGVHGRCGSG